MKRGSFSCSMATYPPKTFAIEGQKPRLICDFIGLKLVKKVKRLIKVDGRLIEAIRVGIHLSPTPKIRVVLDLRPDQDYEIRQAFFVDKNIYAVVLRLKSEVGEREHHGKHSDRR